MAGTGFTTSGLSRLRDVMVRHVDEGRVPGLAWLVARGAHVESGVAGVLTVGEPAPVAPDSIFRIASMTKPVTAVVALQLVEECALRLDDPVDPWLPELSDRQVMRDPHGSTQDLVPARRPISLRDLLTFRLGIGFDFAAAGRQPLMARMSEIGVGLGPPAPGSAPGPDEWMRRLGTLPLERQPGEHWLYHTGSDVLGVLLARASGRPFDVLLAERVLEPLGMADTGFHVPAGTLARLGGAHFTDPGTGDRSVFDRRDGQWSAPPAFPSGGGGLVSTLDDFLRFARMLLDRGRGGHDRIVSARRGGGDDHRPPHRRAAGRRRSR